MCLTTQHGEPNSLYTIVIAYANSKHDKRLSIRCLDIVIAVFCSMSSNLDAQRGLYNGQSEISEGMCGVGFCCCYVSEFYIHEVSLQVYKCIKCLKLCMC